VFTRVPLARVHSNGAFFSPELLITLRAGGIRIVEVGVPHYPRTKGAPKGAPPKVILRAIRDLLLLQPVALDPAGRVAPLPFEAPDVGVRLALADQPGATAVEERHASRSHHYPGGGPATLATHGLHRRILLSPGDGRDSRGPGRRNFT